LWEKETISPVLENGDERTKPGKPVRLKCSSRGKREAPLGEVKKRKRETWGVRGKKVENQTAGGVSGDRNTHNED